jgi:hypothetical protein
MAFHNLASVRRGKRGPPGGEHIQQFWNACLKGLRFATGVMIQGESTWHTTRDRRFSFQRSAGFGSFQQRVIIISKFSPGFSGTRA